MQPHPLIRIERGREAAPGVWEYSVPSLRLCGKSRQPLLDACRQIKSLLGCTSHRAALFREGRDEPDISCPVDAGALVTVAEDNRAGPRFRKYQPFDRASIQLGEVA
jgi:hypothetical protein